MPAFLNFTKRLLMDIKSCYNILKISPESTDEEVAKAFRIMALKYHPDKNPDKREWANEQMIILNQAYSTIMSHRFKSNGSQDSSNSYEEKPTQNKRTDFASAKINKKADRDYLINKFVEVRETAKDAMYVYFQYSLYNFHRRDEIGNRKIYEKMIYTLRKAYHSIQKLSEMTDDKELLEHFDVFGKLIFDFYRASECVNIIDSYKDEYEVLAYRIYRKGDDYLHRAHKELFFDRHNRGYIDKKRIAPDILEAENCFKQTIKVYSKSTWTVESKIKLEYIQSLKAYVSLFFTK